MRAPIHVRCVEHVAKMHYAKRCYTNPDAHVQIVISVGRASNASQIPNAMMWQQRHDRPIPCTYPHHAKPMPTATKRCAAMSTESAWIHVTVPPPSPATATRNARHVATSRSAYANRALSLTNWANWPVPRTNVNAPATMNAHRIWLASSSAVRIHALQRPPVKRHVPLRKHAKSKTINRFAFAWKIAVHQYRYA